MLKNMVFEETVHKVPLGCGLSLTTTKAKRSVSLLLCKAGVFEEEQFQLLHLMARNAIVADGVLDVLELCHYGGTLGPRYAQPRSHQGFVL